MNSYLLLLLKIFKRCCHFQGCDQHLRIPVSEENVNFPVTQIAVQGMIIHDTQCGQGSTKLTNLKEDCSFRINNE
jgi:hypothetical protein